MKKYKLLFFLTALLFSIALFSNEGSSFKEERIGEDEKSLGEKKREGRGKSKKKEENKSIESVMQRQESEKKKGERQVDESDEALQFSSIQVGGLTFCKGTSWHFEEYDAQGNMIGSVFYDKRKLLAKSSIEYSDGKKVGATFTDPNMIVTVRYNSRGEEIAREEFYNEGGRKGKVIGSSSVIYDENGNVLEETKMEKGIPTRHLYTYTGDERGSETVYENGVKTLFVEYKEDVKTVHIFHEGQEISVFDEEIE